MSYKPKIVVITITCNRLELTKKYINQLREKAGYEFKHIVVDNGSTDGTLEWLQNNGYLTLSLDKNYGIIKAWKIGIKYAMDKYNFDFLIKFDNDCEIISENILEKIIKFFRNHCKCCLVAPFDEALIVHSNVRPGILHKGTENNFRVDYVTHTGGIFQVFPKEVIEYFYTASNALVDKDINIGATLRRKGFDSVYLMDLRIKHKGAYQQTKNYKY